eukprot:2801822-Prymnesium_polylepis.1
MKANASPRVDARRCDEAELGRSQDTPSLAKPLDAVPEELRLVSAALLHAARRGSLARTLATPPDEQLWADAGVQQPPSAMRLRKAFEQAKSNRLSQRRKAVTGQDEEHQGALGLRAALAAATVRSGLTGRASQSAKSAPVDPSEAVIRTGRSEAVCDTRRGRIDPRSRPPPELSLGSTPAREARWGSIW